jgi:lipopolysaccharide export system permease protein
VRILDRYVLSEFVAYLAMGLCAFIGIFVIVDVFEKIDVFVDAQVKPALVLRFYLSYVPVVLIEILPVAVLLASLIAFGRMARFHELTAMRTAGRSLMRIYLPILLFVTGLAVASFSLSELVVPEANSRRKHIMNHEIKKKPEFPARRQDLRYVGQGGRIYIVGSYDVRRSVMRDVVIQEFAQGTLARRLDARQGRWEDDSHWVLIDGFVREFDGDHVKTAHFAEHRLEVPEVPEDFAKEERDPEIMGFRELKRWIERFRESGGDAAPYLVDLHLKLATPFVNLVTVILGAALSARIRRGGLAIGFGLSLVISFLYYAMIRAGQAMGHGGNLPPVLAAWIANLVFGGIAILLLARASQEE